VEYFDNINYNPQIEYILEKLPPNEFVEGVYNEEDYVSTEDTKEKIDETLTHVDFLIKECEDRLDGKTKNDVVFEDYKDSARKKYYCQIPLTSSEEKKLEDFEDGIRNVEEPDMAGELYPSFLRIKRDMENEKEYIEDLQKIEDKTFNKILGESASKITEKEQENLDMDLQRFADDDEDEDSIFPHSGGDMLSNIQDRVSDRISGSGERIREDMGDMARDGADDFLDTARGQTDSMDDRPRMFSQDEEETDTQKEYRKKVAAVNEKLKNYRKRINRYEQKYEKKIDENKEEEAQEIKEKIDKLYRKKEQEAEKLGVTASQSFASYAKAEKTDDFLEKAGHMLHATAWDNVGNLCCMLKAIFKSISWEDEDGEETNLLEWIREQRESTQEEVDDANEWYEDQVVELEKIEEVNLEDIRNGIDAIRGLLAISYNENEEKAEQLKDSLMNIAKSLIKPAIQKGVVLLRDIQYIIIDEVKQWMEVLLQSNPQGEGGDPSAGFTGILECASFERLGDYIFDKIEDFFDKLEDALFDLYKMIYKEMDVLDAEMFLLGEKQWIKDIYNVLTKVSEMIEHVENFRFEKDLSTFSQDFLRENGLGYTYNDETGQMEEVDFGGCIEPIMADGKSTTPLSNNVEDFANFTFENNQKFQDFKENQEELEIDCEQCKLEDLEKEEKIKEEVDKDEQQVENEAKEEARRKSNMLDEE